MSLSGPNACRVLTLAAFSLCVSSTRLSAEAIHTLIDPEQPNGGWTFDNGKEFPGATGRLEFIADAALPTLRLHGDFSDGGAYVQAAKALPEIPVEVVDFEIKVPAGVSKVTTRLIDGTGQCHQLDIRLSDKGGWQSYSFPVARYFASVKAGAPMDIVTRYEKWSGANDGRWHQPLKLLVFLAGQDQLQEGSISFRNVRLTTTPPKAEVSTIVRLDDFTDGDPGSWNYNNGAEFKGASGGLTTVETAGGLGLQLRADFSKGGQYVGVRRNLGMSGVSQTQKIQFQARTDDVQEYSLRLVDETGQCHQRHGMPIKSDGKWQTITLEPQHIAGGEHWGGANDGKWHGALSLIEIMLNTRSGSAAPMTLELSDLHSRVVVEAEVASAAWSDTLDNAEGWQLSGDTTLQTLDDNPALQLRRTLETLRTDTTAISPRFPVSRGFWKVEYREQSDLHSPDNSYHGSVQLEVLDAAGSLLETIPLSTRPGQSEWNTQTQSVSLPNNASFARVRIGLEKTYGTYAVDDISVHRLEVQPPEPLVKDIRIASKAIGNLFLPEEDVTFQLSVNTAKALSPEDRFATCVVKNYLGEIVVDGIQAPLSANGSQFTAELTLPADQLNIGQFYELHVSVPQSFGSAATEFSGFAVLPEAASKKFAPEQIPFTIRNWDSRIRDYFYLADRLGLRMLGVWGGWSNDPPYKPHLPGVEICQELNAKWITGTPASDVERNGFKNVTEESLRAGMTNFLKAYADQGLAMIAQGNEPHGTGQVVLDNVRAYKANYEAVKAFDPNIEVIGTSVEPNEEYFQAGYQNYLDSYDFHVYEHYTSVRKVMQQYRALMNKYDAVKPIHSTELGLNSAGQSRLSVAIELIKKCTVFFAEGGKTVSWFTIQYPDPKGTARGQFGDAHCVFDCKFNNFNPRLDAIAHYNMINTMLDKRFVEEEQRDDGTQVFLFRNDAGNSLYVVWNDLQHAELALPIGAGNSAEQIRIDGQRQHLATTDGNIQVTTDTAPLLILFDQQ